MPQQPGTVDTLVGPHMPAPAVVEAPEDEVICAAAATEAEEMETPAPRIPRRLLATSPPTSVAVALACVKDGDVAVVRLGGDGPREQGADPGQMRIYPAAMEALELTASWRLNTAEDSTNREKMQRNIIKTSSILGKTLSQGYRKFQDSKAQEGCPVLVITCCTELRVLSRAPSLALQDMNESGALRLHNK